MHQTEEDLIAKKMQFRGEWVYKAKMETSHSIVQFKGRSGNSEGTPASPECLRLAPMDLAIKEIHAYEGYCAEVEIREQRTLAMLW